MLWTCPALGDGFILIEDDVLSALMAFRQKALAAPESGGILIGFRRGSHLHVTHATTPGPLDCCSRYEFQRRDPIHQQTALELWKRSRHTADYIGEWHTHPQVRPLPSGIDRHEWRQITRAKPAPMIFAIVGLQDWWIGIGQSKRLVIATRRGRTATDPAPIHGC